MTLKEKWEVRRFEWYWTKQGRKDMFTWVHRYLRLHNELLADSVYQYMYHYQRNALIEYVKCDVKGKKMSDEEYGALIDALADIYNQSRAEKVDKYKLLVGCLYVLWKEKLTTEVQT